MPTLRLPPNIPGLKATTATVVRWLKEPGQAATKGELLVELDVEDALIHIEAAESGSLGRILASPGKTITLGAELVEFTSGENAPKPAAVPTNANKGATTMASTAPSGKVTPILMPQAGNSMEEGTIIKWNVKPGDVITLGQIIFEMDTDKASVEVEATEAGRLARIIAPAGAVIPVKQPVAFIADQDSDVDAYLAGSGSTPSAVAAGESTISAAAKGPEPLPESRKSVVSPTDGRVKASPAARKVAAERGLDLASIPSGSGPGGRILSTDLNRAAAASASVAKSAALIVTPAGGVVRRPLSKMRKAIATNLQVSKQTVPHFYVMQTIKADPLYGFYKAQKPTTGCTLNDVVLLAVGKTVAEFPACRSRIEGNEIVEFPNANIGLAVSVDDGLVVPVVMAIEGHSLSTLPAESRRIVEAARKGRLENIGKGVFTISNMGMLGVENFSAIINPPESGILAVAAVREAVIVKDGAMRAGRVMSMTLSVDHRVVDGAMAAQFMNKLKERLENPESLI